jgi:general secretion pathway protein L
MLFLRWWATQLLALVPRQLRDGPADALVVTPDGATPEGLDVRLEGRKRGRLGPARHLRLDQAGLASLRRLRGRRRLVLQAPAGALLVRDVVLPLAAARDPAAVLRYEMDRLTPFTAAEVFWRWSDLRRDRAGDRLLLRLSVVPRDSLAAVRDALAAANLRPDRLEAAVPGGGTVLLDAGAATGQIRGLAILCACLALVAAALPLLRQERTVVAVEARIAALRPLAARAEVLRQGQGADVVSAERARIGDPLQALAALAVLLPADTVLSELSLQGGRLELQGDTAAAARLIGLLAAAPDFRDPAFTAPVTRAADGPGERFTLRAALVP